MDIPTNIKRTMYVYYNGAGFYKGDISIYDFQYSSDDAFFITKFDIDIEFPKDIDFKKEYLAVLESKKDGIQAKYHMKLKEVQDEIDNLLAIEDKSDE